MSLLKKNVSQFVSPLVEAGFPGFMNEDGSVEENLITLLL